ncbi:MAG: PqqD family protein [Bacteroidales bacterium]|nr:PqqD family protein [Bacteroidales bacterium]MDT8375057.1 PqqD family protein [Bacteroidales bacterium]
MMDIELGKYFSLNPVATRIWDMLVQPLSLEELCRLLTEEYEVEVEQCRDETGAYLREMVNIGLVLELK